MLSLRLFKYNKMSKIPTVKVEFKFLPDFIMSKEEYDSIGKWNGFLSLNHINPKDVKKVHYILMDVKDYPTQDWCG